MATMHMTTAAAREQVMLKNFRDPSSALYKGMNGLLRAAQAKAEAVENSKHAVVLPFKVSERAEAALQQQFQVRIKSEPAVMRTTLSPRVAGMVYCIDEVLQEHARGYGRTVLAIDGDAVQLAVRGMQGKVVERTGATARLAAGYAMEDELLRSMAVSGSKTINQRAATLLADYASKEPSYLCSTVREKGVPVDVVTVNHFKTPVGPHQLAHLAGSRNASVLGAFPFQLDMLEKDQGKLAAFPGMYYIDRGSDVITLVPEEDAAASISHPYTALLAFVQNNSVTVGGIEYLLEKYMSYCGILVYSMKAVGADFEAPEILRSHYFDGNLAKLTILEFPKLKKSAAGFPIGWERGEVRVLTDRYEKVLMRVMGTANVIIRPSDAYLALMDNNNLVINTLDTAVPADRMGVSEEDDASLAIALHANFRRHAMKSTLRPLLNAVKARHASSGLALSKMFHMMLVAWFAHPKIKERGEVTDVSCVELLDWCGNDFAVKVADADPWVSVEQLTGVKSVGRGEVYYSHMPRPVHSTFTGRVKATAVGGVVRTVGALRGVSVKGSATALVNRVEVVARPTVSVLTNVKNQLRAKLFNEQCPCPALPVEMRFLRDEHATSVGVGPCPVPDVDVIGAVRADAALALGGVPERSAVATGYRLADVDIVKEIRGNMSINDAKRLIPKPRYVREPVIDVGVEGARVPSQASLLGAVFKRNVGIPNNRESVDLDRFPRQVAEKVVRVCFRDNWQEILKRHLEDGLWQPCEPDIDDYLSGLDEAKAKAMLDEFFLEGEVTLREWVLMAKGKVKSSREEGALRKVDHAQTIMFLQNKSTNALYSAQTRRFKRCLDEMMRPEITLNSQRTASDHEDWYNSLEGQRASVARTYVYASDIRCYDRSQEHPALMCEMEFYRMLGLSQETYDKWVRTHGVKVAMSSMFGLVLRLVAGGVSGLWKTLLRNGLINLFAVVVAADLKYTDVVMLDIKGDDMDLELARPIEVETTANNMCRMFNLSAKFYRSDIRYMCKDFRFKKNGRWYHMRDPWAAWQSILSPVWLDTADAALVDRWESIVNGLHHYDNGILVDEVADLAAQFYGKPGCFRGMARALAKVKTDRSEFVKLFGTPRMIS